MKASPSGMLHSPTRYLHGDGAVVLVPARVAAWLSTYAGLDRLRVAERGADPEVDAVLLAMAVAAAAWRTSVVGSEQAKPSEVAPGSEWMSTADVADHLDVSTRAVTLAITDGRLPAEKFAGRWRVSREALAHYTAARAA